jgi:predicted nucleotidyltransferase
MKRSHALQILNKVKPIIVEKFGVTKLALFGSRPVTKLPITVMWIFW